LPPDDAEHHEAGKEHVNITGKLRRVFLGDQGQDDAQDGIQSITSRQVRRKRTCEGDEHHREQVIKRGR